MPLSIIVAVSENGVIGKDGDLPWRLPRDLSFFKRTTMGHVIIMGRKTFESIGRPLPGRKTWILTRDKTYSWEGDGPEVRIFHHVSKLKEAAHSQPQCFVIGGGEIYQVLLPEVSRVLLTRVHIELEGDTFFPELSQPEWVRLSAEAFPPDAKNPHPMTIESWERK